MHHLLRAPKFLGHNRNSARLHMNAIGIAIVRFEGSADAVVHSFPSQTAMHRYEQRDVSFV